MLHLCMPGNRKILDLLPFSYDSCQSNVHGFTSVSVLSCITLVLSGSWLYRVNTLGFFILFVGLLVWWLLSLKILACYSRT